MASRSPVFKILNGDTASAALSETIGNPAWNTHLQTQGRLSFTDSDLSDRHSLCVSSITSSTGKCPLGTIKLRLVQDSNGGATGRLEWSYDVPAAFVEFLAAGQILTETFRIEVSDGRGGKAFQDVTITITGTNDAPRIIETCWSSHGECIFETPGTPVANARLSANGKIFYVDPDLTDQPSVSASFKPANGHSQALGAIAVTQSPTGCYHDAREVSWNYVVDASKIEFLSKGQIYTETYTLKIDDHHGGVTTKDITVTLVGTNDSPVISLQGGDTIASTLAASIGSAQNYMKLGRVSFRDVDLNDTHLVTVAFKSSTLSNRSQIGALTASILSDSTSGGTGQVGWTFAVNDVAARGLTGIVTEVFTLTILDGLGGVTKQDVTLTLNFSRGNTPPSITVSNPAAVSEASVSTIATVNIANQVSIADPDTADARAPYAGGLAFQSATGPAPSGATIASLFSLNATTGVISYDRAAFQYLAGGQSVTASFGFNSASGPDTQAKQITLTITGVNQAPSITVSNPAAVSEASVSTIATVNIASQVSIADPDTADARAPYAGGLAFQSATGPAPSGATIASLFSLNATTGVISYDRAAFQYLAGGQSVTASFGFNSASGPDTQAKQITLTITGVNQAPSITVSNPAAVSEASVSTIATVNIASQVSIADPDTADARAPYAGGLAFQSATGPAPSGATIASLFSLNATTGVISYDRAAFQYLAGGQSVTASFGFNSASGPDTQAKQITLTITGVNQAPSITVSNPAAVSEASVSTIATVNIASQVSIADPDTADARAPYAGGLAFQSATGPAPSGATIASLFSLNATTGVISYDRAAFQYLAGGQSVTASFGFNSASGPDTQAKQITLTITGVNQAPSITVSNPAAVSEASVSTIATVNIASQVSIADPDTADARAPYAGGLAFQSATGPAPSGATIASLFSLNATTGVISYDRAAFQYLAGGQSVTASFGFNSASGPDTQAKQITLTITGVNQAPSITVSNPAAVSEASVSTIATVNIASQVSIADPDTADARAPYAGGLAFQSATGPAPSGATIASLFSLNATTGVISYDRAAFQYLAGGQSVTASFGFNSASGPDTQAKQITLTINGVDTSPSSPFSLRLAATDATTPDGFTTSASAVTLIGTGRPGDLVELFRGGTSPIATTRIDVNSAFQFTNISLTAGANSFNARASNATEPPQTIAQSFSLLAPANVDNVATVWNRIALQSIAATAVSPEFASRALAIESIAIYNVISAINGTRGYLFNAVAPIGASVTAAVAQAAHDALLNLFPSQNAKLDALLTTTLAGIADSADKAAGIAFGASVAARVIALRANDGWNIEMTDTGSNAVGAWRPTAPAYAPGADPQWASLTPFTLQSDTQFEPAAPPPIDSQAYADAYAEVKSLGEGNSTTRTADQTAIARFWAAGVGSYTPIGMWNDIANNLTTSKGLSLSQTAQMLIELNLAGGDAAIAAWNAKYAYDEWRPVTAIQQGEFDGNANTPGEADWQPYLLTPNFPSYVSGHSTFSAAAAQVLESVFGANTSFNATSLTLGGATRSYNSFDEAAAEAGQSRIYGGIHYQFDNQAGLQLGTEIGDWVLDQFSGQADTQGPRIQTDGGSRFYTSGPLTISGDLTDNLSGVVSATYALDGGPAIALPFSALGRFSLDMTPLLASLPDGRHSVVFGASDAAGNAAQGLGYNFVLARNAPVITLDGGSIRSGGTLDAASHLKGAVKLPDGDTLVSLRYHFDGGPDTPIVFDPSELSFDSSLMLAKVPPGARTLTLTSVDAAGNTGTLSLSVTMPYLPLTIAAITPDTNVTDVGVTYRPRVTFSRAVDISTLTTTSFYATDTTGAVLQASVVPLSDGTGAWLLFQNALPGSSTITLHLEGDRISTVDGVQLSGAGSPGSDFTKNFVTVSTNGVPGTTITGVVLDPGVDLKPMTRDDVRPGANGFNDYANNTYLNPLAGVKVYILGHESEAVYTDATGRFTITNAPVGDLQIAVDGRTATNAPAGQFFPEMVMDMFVRPGIVNTVMGGMGSLATQLGNSTNPTVYLPRIPTASLTPLNTVGETVIHAVNAGSSLLTGDQLSRLSITVQAGSLVDAQGNPVANATIGIAPVPSELVMDMLPPGLLQHSFDITIQAPQGAVFTTPASITFPNVLNLAPGSKTSILSFDHTTGRLVIDGTGTVSADGLTVTSDPGSGITAPGWHGFAPSTAQLERLEQLKRGDTSIDVVTPLNIANTQLTGAASAVKQWGSPTARANLGTVGELAQATVGTRLAGVLPGVVGTGFSVVNAQADAASYEANFNAYQNSGSVSDGLLAATDFVKFNIDTASAGIGVADTISAATGAGIPTAIGGEVIKDTLNIAGAGIGLLELVGQSAAGLVNLIENRGNREAVPGPDPDLVLRVSKVGANGRIAIYVDGALQQQVDVTASRSLGQSELVTITGILGTALHHIEIRSIGVVSGSTLATQNDVFVEGASFNSTSYAFRASLFGALPDAQRTAVFDIGSRVTAVQTDYQSTAQRALAENAYWRLVYPKIVAGLTAANELHEFTKNQTGPTYGLTNAFLSPRLQAMSELFEAYRLLDAHEPAMLLMNQLIDKAVGLLDQQNANLFAKPSSTTDAGNLAGTPLETTLVAPGTRFYAVLDDLLGNVQRFDFAALDGLRLQTAPITLYKLTVLDPLTNRTGTTFFTSAAAGGITAMPQINMFPDRSTPQANGFTAGANYVLGFGPDADQITGPVPPVARSNIIPGVTDAEAFRQGLVTNPALANTTGVISGVQLRGEAVDIALAAYAANSSGLSAYVATGSYGFAIVDVSDRLKPVIQAQIDLPHAARSVAIDAGLQLAVVVGGDTTSVIDVSNATAPRVVRSVVSQGAQDVAAANGQYIVQNALNLLLYDLATGDLIAIAPIGGSSINGLLVEAGSLYAMDSTGLLRVYALSDTGLSLVGSLQLHPNNGKMTFGEGVLYIGEGDAGNTGYSTVNVVNPAFPSLITDGGIPFGTPSAQIAGNAIALNGSGRGVGVQTVVTNVGGNFSSQASLDVFDVTNPNVTNNLSARYVLPGNPFDVVIGSGTAFVADGSAGLQIVNYQGTDRNGLAPIVTMTTLPQDQDATQAGLQLFEGQLISIPVRVRDDVQAARTELLVNGRVVEVDPSYPWALRTYLPTIAANGSSTVTVQVRAVDTGGNIGLSQPIVATLIANPTPFSLAGAFPRGGQSIGSSQRSLTFDFSAPVDESTVNASTIRLVNSLGQALTPVSFDIQRAGQRVIVTFDPLPIGSLTVDLVADSIRDTAGRPLGAADVLTNFNVVPYSISWIGGANGTWNTTQNWSPERLPAVPDDVLIRTINGGEVVYNNQFVSGAPSQTAVQSLSVTGAGVFRVTRPSAPNTSAIDLATKRLSNDANFVIDTTLEVNGDIVNTGTISTETTAANSYGRLQIKGDGLYAGTPLSGRVNLTGGGTIKLGGPTANSFNSINGSNQDNDISGQFFSYFGNAQLVNHDNTITGQGIIGNGLDILLDTNGRIIADNGETLVVKPQAFSIAGGSFGSAFNISRYLTNSGLMQARNFGTLQIATGTGISRSIFEVADLYAGSGNNFGGAIEASGGTVELSGGMAGGTLRAVGSNSEIHGGFRQTNGSFQGSARLQNMTIDMRQAPTFTMKGNFIFDGGGAAQSYGTNIPVVLLGEIPLAERTTVGVAGLIQDYGIFKQFGADASGVSMTVLGDTVLDGGGGNVSGTGIFEVTNIDDGAPNIMAPVTDDNSVLSPRTYAPENTLRLQNGLTFTSTNSVLGYDQGYNDPDTGDYIPAPKWTVSVDQTSVLQGSGGNSGALTLLNLDLRNEGRVQTDNGRSLTIRNSIVTTAAGYIGTNDSWDSVITIDNSDIVTPTVYVPDLIEAGFLGTLSFIGDDSIQNTPLRIKDQGNMVLEAGAQVIYNSIFSFAFPNIDNQYGGTITLNAGSRLTVDANMSNDGKIFVNGGVVAFNNNLGGSGEIDLNGQAMVSIVSGTDQNIYMTGDENLLSFLETYDFHGQIYDFGIGDTLDLRDVYFDSIASYTTSTSFLEIDSNGTNYHLDINLTGEPGNYQLANDGSGGTLVKWI